YAVMKKQSALGATQTFVPAQAKIYTSIRIENYNSVGPVFKQQKKEDCHESNGFVRYVYGHCRFTPAAKAGRFRPSGIAQDQNRNARSLLQLSFTGICSRLCRHRAVSFRLLPPTQQFRSAVQWRLRVKRQFPEHDCW